MTRTVNDHYSGAFDPGWSLERLSRPALARLCREYQMLAMFHDRAWMPHVAAHAGIDATVVMADGEWMGSSPIYTRRNLTNVGALAETVEASFKGMQLDIGGPDHYLDFRFEVISNDEGFFWTEFCGPHDHVRRLTDNDAGTVRQMCHDMEDRTFDATFGAVNPKARATPVYRPPRPDEFSGHHCRWRLHIDDSVEAAPPHPTLAVVEASRLIEQGQPLERAVLSVDGLTDDYSGPLRTWFRLEDFSHAFLVRQAKEYALDVHLLMRAAYVTAQQEWGGSFVAGAAPQHRAGFAPGLVARLRDALGIDGDDIEAVAKILQVDPVQVPDYCAWHVVVDDERRARVWVSDCAALADDPRSPLGALMSTPETPGFEHMVHAVQPRARVRPIPVDAIADAVLAWEIDIDPANDPVAPHPMADMVNLHEITTFDLTARPETPVEISAP